MDEIFENNPPAPGRYWRHLKRGTTYVEVARGELQTGFLLAEGTQMIAYRSTHDGRVWFRPVVQFEDGRFEELK